MPPSDDHVNPPNKVALVIGGNGVTGSYILEHLLGQPAGSWASVISISRKPPFMGWLKEMSSIPGSGVVEGEMERMSKAGGSSGRLHWICSDLLVDSQDVVEEKLMKVGGDKITHVFYAGYVVIDGWMGKKEWPVGLTPSDEANLIHSSISVTAARFAFFYDCLGKRKAL